MVYEKNIGYNVRRGGDNPMDNYSKIISNNIMKYRKINGYTQDALAEKLGVTFQAVSKWENEQSCPDILLLPRLAEVLKISIDELFGKEAVKAKSKTHNHLISDLPWPDDNVVRGVVFLGHKILDTCEDMSKFTFKLEGQALNVVSHCNIECNQIQSGAQAACNINCGGSISGGANAGCDINCGGALSGGANAGCDIKTHGISGDTSAGGDITVGHEIEGAVKCGGDLTCHTIKGDVICHGDIIYEKG